MAPLPYTAIRGARPREKAYKMFDERGLYLIVTPTGGRWWRLRYRHDGKENLISLGVYPDVGLKAARAGRDEARKLLAAGITPGVHRKALKAAQAGVNSLATVAREWHARHAPSWTPDHAAKMLGLLERDIFPWLGSRPISEITAPELLTVLRRIESRGAVVIARRGLSCLSRIFAYAIATGRAERNPATDIRGALTPSIERHHAAITDPSRVGGLLRAIDEYEGSFVTRSALRLAPLVFLRPGELRKAEWSEFNLEIAEWRIPASKMKMRAQHIVPLSTQALAILREVHPLTGHGRYVFPGAYRRERPMSCNTLTAAIRRLGYTGDEMTAHGFRTVASTLLNEMGWNRDAIERQLAHAERNAVRAAYSHAEYLPERRKLMQWWSNYLDGLRGGVETGVDYLRPEPAEMITTGLLVAIEKKVDSCCVRRDSSNIIPARVLGGYDMSTTRSPAWKSTTELALNRALHRLHLERVIRRIGDRYNRRRRSQWAPQR